MQHVAHLLFFFFWASFLCAYDAIENVSELRTKVRPGDWVVLDIDETISRRGMNKARLLLDPEVPALIKDWQKMYPHAEKSKQIRVILLTANKQGQNLKKHLISEGFPENIQVVIAPNIQAQGLKTPTKGKKLVELLTNTFRLNRPKRLFVVDDAKSNLDNIKLALSSHPNFKNIFLDLLQKKTNYKIFESTTDPKEIFPQVLNHFQYVRAISGGSGGVHVLKDPDGKFYTFKCVLDSDEMKEEILADALYRALSVKVPAFAVYDEVPAIKQLQKACVGPGPYRLAHYIESDDGKDKIRASYAKLEKDFLADALLSNWDIAVGDLKNTILDKQGILWRIDNGGSLRYRATGGQKTAGELWDPFKVTEIKTMRDPARESAIVYAGLTDDDLKQQAQNILKHREQLLATLDSVSSIIHIKNPDFVKESLYRRLDDLIERFNIESAIQSRYAEAMKPASAKSAAGILIYSIDPKTNEPVILLGQRKGHRWWGDLGGKSDVDKGSESDKTLADTAARETKEESRGMLSFTPLELNNTPSHEIINERDGVLYRMYFAPHPYVESNKIKNAPEEPAYHWTREHEDFRWVPVKDFLKNIKKGKEVLEENQKTLETSDGFILFPPFWEMLKEFDAKLNLKAIAKKQKLLARHTQRTPSTQPWETFEAQRTKLAQTVVKHAQVMAEMKRRAALNDDDDNNETSLAELLSHTQAEAIRKELRAAPYSQTESYLAWLMTQHKLHQLGHNSEAQVDVFLREYSKFKKQLVDASKDYKKALAQALATEKLYRFKDKAVFYHGVDSLTSFLYDLISAYRAQLKIVDPKDLTVFRGIESAFSSVLDVQAFINKYTTYDGKVDNYAAVEGINYADMGLSVNPFLFGNDGIEGSCTYYYFYKMKSAVPVDIEKFFNSFLAATGIPGEYRDYKALYQQYYFRDGKENTKLFQIFIDPEVVDSVAYIAVAGGNVLNIKLDDNSLYHGFAKILDEMRTFPDQFNNRLKSVTMNTLQGRLFLKPEIFHNPKYVTIKSYWHHEVEKQVEKSFKQKLQAQVASDLSRWLVSHSSAMEGTFVEGTPALKKLYQKVYEGTLGLKYTEAEAISLLPMAVSRGDFSTIKKILDKYPDIINQDFPNLNYREKQDQAKTTNLLEMVPWSAPHKIDILNFLLDKNIDIDKTEMAARSVLAAFQGQSENLNRELYRNNNVIIPHEAMARNMLKYAVDDVKVSAVDYILNNYPKINLNGYFRTRGNVMLKHFTPNLSKSMDDDENSQITLLLLKHGLDPQRQSKSGKIHINHALLKNIYNSYTQTLDAKKLDKLQQKQIFCKAASQNDFSIIEHMLNQNLIDINDRFPKPDWPELSQQELNIVSCLSKPYFKEMNDKAKSANLIAYKKLVNLFFDHGLKLNTELPGDRHAFYNILKFGDDSLILRTLANLENRSLNLSNLFLCKGDIPYERRWDYYFKPVYDSSTFENIKKLFKLMAENNIEIQSLKVFENNKFNIEKRCFNAKDVPFLQETVILLNLALTNALLNDGADPNFLDGEGYTPLHWAVSLAKDAEESVQPKHLGMIKLLIDRGADVNKEDVDGFKALDYLKEYKSEYIDRIRALLK